MKNIFLAFIILSSISTNAQVYNMLFVPDSLTKNANMVKRYDELRIEIKDAGKARIYTKHAYTILNEAGDKYAEYASFYDKLNDINYIEGALYDAMGKEIKRVKKKDIEDVSDDDGISLMTDNRLKVHNFYYRAYPYTVEYEEEDEKDGIFHLPTWFPQSSGVISVQYSKLTVITPKNIDIRYKLFNSATEPKITEDKDKKIYTWEIKNIPARVYEHDQPSWRKISPFVMLGPTEFEIENYKGNMSSWENYGLFVNTLLQGRDALPESVKQKVHELTDGVKDQREKVKILYTFLQQNTRYISVQLGIGGWQPFDANYVYTKKYGDCKALSNYMVAILKEAGIKANYALIIAGDDRDDMVTDFPCTQFNHATVCVPMQKDTMWLECTDQSMPAGYVSDFTGNRHAVMIDEKGGHVVATTKYNAEDNKQVRSINATVDETGKLNAAIDTRYSCLEQDKYHNMLNYLNKDKKLEYLNKSLDIPDYHIADFDYKETKQEKPFIDEHLQLVSNGYASVSGKRFFITPNLLSKYTTKLSATETRKNDIQFNSSFVHVDSVQITVPAGYIIEAMPKDLTLESKFGQYSASYKFETDKIIYIRYYKRTQGLFPATSYNDMVKFYNDIYKADRSKIVLVKKEG